MNPAFLAEACCKDSIKFGPSLIVIYKTLSRNTATKSMPSIVTCIGLLPSLVILLKIDAISSYIGNFESIASVVVLYPLNTSFDCVLKAAPTMSVLRCSWIVLLPLAILLKSRSTPSETIRLVYLLLRSNAFAVIFFCMPNELGAPMIPPP